MANTKSPKFHTNMSSWKLIVIVVLAALVVGAIVLAVLPPSPGGERGLQALKEELEAAGYDLIYPLTTGYKVGYLYEVRETAQGTKFRRTLCEAAFINAEPITEALKLADFQSNKESNFEFFIGLSERLLRDRGTAQAALKTNGAVGITLSFANLKSYELPPKLRPDGAKRSVDRTCEINIRSAIDGEGQFLRPTYLVVGAVRSDTINYQFQTAGTFGFDIEAQMKSLFTLKPKVETDTSGKKWIVVTPNEGRQFAFGGQALALSHAQVLPEVTDDFSVAFREEKNASLSPAETFALPEE